MADAIITRRGGGGSKINGIIEQYKVAAGANVSAGDFVRFAAEKLYTGSVKNTYFGSPTLYLIDENTVLIGFVDDYGYAQIVKINNGAISFGTLTKVTTTEADSSPNESVWFSRINNTGFYLACYKYVTSGGSTIYHAMVLKVSNKTVSIGATTYAYSMSKYTDAVIVYTGEQNAYVFNAFNGTITYDAYTFTSSSITKVGSTKYYSPGGTNLSGIYFYKMLSDTKLLLCANRSTGGTFFVVYDVENDTFSLTQTSGISLGKEISDMVMLPNGDLAMVCCTRTYYANVDTYHMFCYKARMNTDGSWTVSPECEINMPHTIGNTFWVKFISVSENELGLLTRSGQFLYEIALVRFNVDDTINSIVSCVDGLRDTEIALVVSDVNGNVYSISGTTTLTADYYRLLNVSPRNTGDMGIGIAKTGGAAGETIDVIVPN